MSTDTADTAAPTPAPGPDAPVEQAVAAAPHAAPPRRARAADGPARPRGAGGMRARLARIGTKGQATNPVLEPLFRVVKANHPKADLALLERAYYTAAAAARRARSARAASPTSPTRWR